MNVPASRGKRALVLAGGGISGAVYEMGALRAIDDLLLNYTVNDFDIYVGTSAGSLVGACLANGITPRELMRTLEGALPDTGRLQRNRILAPNLRDMLRRSRRLPGLLLRHSLHALRHPREFSPLDWMWGLLGGLPTGIYTGDNLERYLRDFLSQRGSNAFAQLQRELYIVATQLNTGDRAVFGTGSLRDVPISQAVAASSAMPIMFQPVHIDGIDYIDGGVRGTASLDVAIDQGAKLIVCINPLVPLDNSDQKLGHPIVEEGIQAIGNQVFRTFIHAGLHYHIKKLGYQHPDVDIILIEPRRDDVLVFSDHIMRYSTRMTLARHGYESVTLHLADQYTHFKQVLARHDIAISRQRVATELSLHPASEDPVAMQQLLEGPSPLHHLTGGSKSWRTAHLAHALNDLEASLNELDA